MLFLDDTKPELKSQWFESKQIGFRLNNDKVVVFFQSTKKTKDVNCLVCNGEVHIYPVLAQAGWNNWFAAAKESNIPALERFARLKKPRIHGLIAHAAYPINTGKLEGFNNKIKVAKRIGYGYRDDNYFFKLIRYLALPSVKSSSPNFP